MSQQAESANNKSRDQQAADKSLKTTTPSSSKMKLNQAEIMSMKTQAKLVANLHSAANEGKVELVRLLLRCGANVNAQDEQVSFTI